MWTLFIKNALHVKNMKRSTYGNTMCKIKATFKHNDLNDKHCSQVVTGPIQVHTSRQKDCKWALSSISSCVSLIKNSWSLKVETRHTIASYRSLQTSISFHNNTFFIDHSFCYCYQCIGVDDSFFFSLSCVLALLSQFFTKDAHIWPMQDHQICSPLLPFAPKNPAQTLEWPYTQLNPSSLLSSMPCCYHYLTSELNNLTSILTQNDAACPRNLLVLHYPLSLGPVLRLLCCLHNSCYYSWAHRQNFFCLLLHANKAKESIQWEMTH